MPSYTQARISPKLEADNRTLHRDVFFINSDEQDYRINNMAIARFDAAGLKHKVLIGVELAHHPIAFNNTTADLASINMVNPIYGASPTNLALRNRQRIDTDTVGIYAQDIVTIVPQVNVVAGARFDYSARKLHDSVTGAKQSAYDNRLSPRIGVVYSPFNWFSWYANYSTSFKPANDITSLRTKGILYAPELGKQYETGVKFDVAPRLTSTIALYQIERENVLTTDPLDPTMKIPVGGQRSRGAELDLSWAVARGWNVLFNYAYTNAEITKDNVVKVGNRPANVPEQSARLWTSYKIPTGPLTGLSVGAGFYHVGTRYGDAADSFTLPSYTTVDAFLSYKWRRRYRFSVNLHNLFNTRYFEAAASRNSVFPGTPFTVRGTMEILF